MTLRIPPHALKYILFQRTEYATPFAGQGLCARAVRKVLPLRFRVWLETELFSKQIARAFGEDMEKEYLSVKDFLPERVDALLDIGCGVAGIDSFLYRHYEGQPRLYLLDKSRIDKQVHYGFEDSASFYNSLAEAKALLLLNGVEERKIHACEVGKEKEALSSTHFDLIISLISWGFHYPVSTYLDWAYERLAPGGRVILDVRKQTEGEELISKKFGNCTVVLESEKHRRLAATKRALSE